MSVSAKAGTFAVTTSLAVDDTVQVTGVGFQPTFVIFFASGRNDTSDASGNADGYRSIGVAGGIADRVAHATSSLDAYSNAQVNAALDTDACFGRCGNNAWDGKLDLSSFDSDGFTLVVTQVFGANERVHYLALGGDSLTDVAVGSFSNPASTGDQAVTGVGFQPDSLLLMSMGSGTGARNDSVFVFGATDGTNEACVNGSTNKYDNTPGGEGYFVSDHVLYIKDMNEVSNLSSATFKSFDGDGFTLTYDNSDSQDAVVYVALKGASVAVGTTATRTDTTQWSVSGLGFQPAGVVLVSEDYTEASDGGIEREDTWSMGAFTGASERVACTVHEVGVDYADSEVGTAIYYDAVLVHLAGGSGTALSVAGVTDVVSIDSGGFTLVQDDADVLAARAMYIAFGPAGGGGGLPASAQVAGAVLAAVAPSAIPGSVSRGVAVAPASIVALGAGGTPGAVGRNTSPALALLTALDLTASPGAAGRQPLIAVAILSALDAAAAPQGAAQATFAAALLAGLAASATPGSVQRSAPTASALFGALAAGSAPGTVTREGAVAPAVLTALDASVTPQGAALAQTALAFLFAVDPSASPGAVSVTSEPGIASLLASLAGGSPGGVPALPEAAWGVLSALGTSALPGTVAVDVLVAIAQLQALSAQPLAGAFPAVAAGAAALLEALPPAFAGGQRQLIRADASIEDAVGIDLRVTPALEVSAAIVPALNLSVEVQ